MSLVLYGGGVIDNRGSISGNTYSRSKFGATIRAKTSPINIKNNFTTRNRANLQTVSGLWQTTLTETERQGWNAFALVNPVTNVFGQISYLSGMQWFTKCAINQTNFGVPIVTTAPTVPAPSAPLSLSVAATNGSPGAIVITYTEPTLTGTPTLVVWVTPMLSPGLSFANNQFRLVTYVAPGGSPSDIEADWHTRFGAYPLVLGKKIFVMAYNMNVDNGTTSAAIIANGIIT
jgi:hypothetical protein